MGGFYSQVIQAEALREWFLMRGRELPWRGDPTPYSVWVSEIMLQQTQVAVVIPYFLRWMERFPSIHSLASASIEEVLKLWEGLGYYSRARRLHQGAQHVVQQHGGNIPADLDSLKQIPGIGEYTAGAILAFAFHQKAAAIDGNVLRVACRYFGFRDDIARRKTHTLVQRRILNSLPEKAPWEVTEALIELGAVVCKRKPCCDRCPLRTSCYAYRTKQQEELPVKSTKVAYQMLHRAVAVVRAGNSVLLRRGQTGSVMADLYEFPYVETEGPLSAEELMERLPLRARAVMALDEVSHAFTRYRVQLYPWFFECEVTSPLQNCQWVPLDQLHELPFSAGHRRVLRKFLSIELAQF